MTGAFRPFRVLKRRATGILYVALPDLVSYFEQKRGDSKTPEEETMWDNEAEKFKTMIFEGLDHDL